MSKKRHLSGEKMGNDQIIRKEKGHFHIRKEAIIRVEHFHF